MRLPLNGRAAALMLWRCSRWRAWLACSLSTQEPPGGRDFARVRARGQRRVARFGACRVVARG